MQLVRDSAKIQHRSVWCHSNHALKCLHQQEPNLLASTSHPQVLTQPSGDRRGTFHLFFTAPPPHRPIKEKRKPVGPSKMTFLRQHSQAALAMLVF